jgi:hypothetical protein
MTRAEKLVRVLLVHEKPKFPPRLARINNLTANHCHFVQGFKNFRLRNSYDVL